MTRSDPGCLRLERRIAADVAASSALRPGERVLLLLSGGADSMALLSLTRAVDRALGLGLGFAALHVDYRTRGADSDRDREIVERACAAAGVPLHVVRLRRPLSGGDFQARARALRYRRARELAAARGYDAVVTAHNRDDQAETILYRLVKYASPRGLCGMRARDGDLSRPLLGAGAAELRAYCRARGIEYGEDASNAEPAYARNRLRLDVLPRLAELNPRVAETLAATALQAAAEAEVLAAASAAARARVTLDLASAAGVAPGSGGGAALAAVDVAALAAEPPALRALVLHDLVREARGGDALVERRQVEALGRLAARADAAGRADLGGGLEAVRTGGLLLLRRRLPPHRCPPAPVAGAALVAAGDAGVEVSFCGAVWRLRLLRGPVVERDAAVRGEAFVGLAGTPALVALRHPRRGERFSPSGLGAETTVARYLAGARAPGPTRPRAVVVEVDGGAAWLGYERAEGPAGRVAQSFRVHDSSETTLHVFREGT